MILVLQRWRAGSSQHTRMHVYFYANEWNNCSSVLPFIATERSVIYREGLLESTPRGHIHLHRLNDLIEFHQPSEWSMYIDFTTNVLLSVLQVTVEIPHKFLQAILFSAITYPAVNFYWLVHKVFWYFYTIFCTVLFFNYYGMLLVSAQ